MEVQTVTVNVIKADEGKILTDGEVFGRVIYLAKGRSADEFYEITEAEYEEIQKQDEANTEESL